MIIKKIINDCGYEIEKVELHPSSRPDLGQYQYNGVMSLAKKYHQKGRFHSKSGHIKSHFTTQTRARHPTHASTQNGHKSQQPQKPRSYTQRK